MLACVCVCTHILILMCTHARARPVDKDSFMTHFHVVRGHGVHNRHRIPSRMFTHWRPFARSFRPRPPARPYNVECSEWRCAMTLTHPAPQPGRRGHPAHRASLNCTQTGHCESRLRTLDGNGADSESAGRSSCSSPTVSVPVAA